jgi:hypothetical protein
MGTMTPNQPTVGSRPVRPSAPRPASAAPAPATSMAFPATSVAPAAPQAHLRPLAAGEEAQIRRIFRATLLLGRPLPIETELAAYEHLCLDWYLTSGEVVVAVEDGHVRGYLLACLDHAAYERWARRQGLRWGTGELLRITCGRRRGDARRFSWLRMRDGVASWRHAPPPVFPAHAHLNLDPEIRGGNVGHRLAATMDDLVAAAGLPGWFGELNVPAGRSLSAITRAGAIVVHRQPNRTFSWLLGTSVDRATIARPLATATDSVRR